MLTGACAGGLGSLTCSKAGGGGTSTLKMVGQCGAAVVCSGIGYAGGICGLCQFENKVNAQDREAIFYIIA